MIRSLLAAITLVALGVAPIAGEVVRVEVDSREDVLGGQPFGAAGAYEKITGRIYFAFDPDNPMNARIVDIGLAPRNAAGVTRLACLERAPPQEPPPGRGTSPRWRRSVALPKESSAERLLSDRRIRQGCGRANPSHQDSRPRSRQAKRVTPYLTGQPTSLCRRHRSREPSSCSYIR